VISYALHLTCPLVDDHLLINSISFWMNLGEVLRRKEENDADRKEDPAGSGGAL
jgi:hypothetical protein